MASLCHPWFTTTNLSYRFPIFETSATALCGTTGNRENMYKTVRINYCRKVFCVTAYPCVSTSVPLTYMWAFGFVGRILFFKTAMGAPFSWPSRRRRHLNLKAPTTWNHHPRFAATSIILFLMSLCPLQKMVVKNGHGQGQNAFCPVASSYASPKRAPQDLRFKEPVVGHNAGWMSNWPSEDVP